MAMEVEVVQAFHEHFNAGRTDDVLAMATEDVSVGGGRGKDQGSQLLHEWVGRATTTMTPLRWFRKDDVVVIEEQVEWHTGDGDVVTDSTVWGLAFTVVDGKIAAIARYANIGEAVTSSGLDETHEVSGS